MSQIDNTSVYPIKATPIPATQVLLGYDPATNTPMDGVQAGDLPVSTPTTTAITAAVSTHAALTDAHGATAANTASRIVARSAGGTVALSGVQLDTAATPTQAAGMISWDAVEETAQVGVNASEAISVGTELSPRYRNTSGSTMANGTAVYITGATGSNTNIGLAKADALATCRSTIGIVTTDAGITNNGFGRVCTYGVSHNHDTSAYTAGDILWVSTTTAGAFTNVEPTVEGTFKMRIGSVQRAHATQGEIFVDPEFFGSVTGDAVMSAATKSAARTAIGAASLTGGNTFTGTQAVDAVQFTDPVSENTATLRVEDGTILTTSTAYLPSGTGTLLLETGDGSQLTGVAPLNGNSEIPPSYRRGATILVRTSDYCTSDSVLSLSSPTIGADQTTALQAILDLAQTSPLTVIWDGAYATTGLKIRSNTRIVAHPFCGAILRNNSYTSQQALFENYNKSLLTKSDARITIEGGIWHGNRAGQSVTKDTTFGWHTILAFGGISNLKVIGSTFYAPSTFCSIVANADDVTYQNNLIRVGTSAINLDGFKFNFGSRYRVLNTDASCYDDAVSFTANEVRQNGTDPALWGSLGDPIGTIYDAIVDGLQLADSTYGVRVLSSTERIDRVIIKNVTGETRNNAFVIDNYSENPTYARPCGLGNFGAITISDVNVRMLATGYKACYLFVGGVGDSLTIRNFRRSDFSTIAANFPTFRIDGTNGSNNFGETNWRSITIDGYDATDMENTQSTDHITVKGVIQNLRVIDPRIYVAGAASGNLLKVESGGVIRQFYRSGVQSNAVANVVSNSGTIDVTTVGVADVNTPNGSTWLIENRGYSEDTSDPGYLLSTTTATTKAYAAKKFTADRFGGNVQVSANITLAGTGVETVGLFARGTRSLPWAQSTATGSNYSVVLNFGGQPNTAQLAKLVGGSASTLATRSGISLPAGDYLVRLTCKNSTISAAIQRASDSQWLNSSSTWQAGETTFASVTDTSIAASSGEYGVVAYSNSAAGKTYNDFTAIAAP